MLFGILKPNNRILSLTGFIAVVCCASICCAEDAWNTTIQEATIKFIQQLTASVDTSQRPCDDFHGFICNNRSTAHQFTPRPSEEEIFRQFLESADEEQLMDVELKLKRFHESCQTARGAEHLKSSHLYRITGGWPALEGAAAKRREAPSWMNIVASFHDIGMDYFFKHRVEIKSNKRYVQLQANLNFKYSLRKNTQLAKELLQSYGIESDEARIIALDFAGLEGYRREISKTASDGTPTVMTYGEFKAKFSNNDWDVYFRRVLGKALKDTDGIRLEDEQKLERVFDMLSKTPGTRLQNFVWIDYLLDKAEANCLDLVRQYFKPVYRYIVQRSAIDKRRIAQLFSDIGSVYQSLLHKSVWIDEISNEKSKLYLGKMIHVTLNGDAKLDADYASLTVTKKNFYRNLEKCQRFAQTAGDVRRILTSSSASLGDLYEFFMSPIYNEMLVQPLYYGSIGEAFAEKMIDGGGDSSTAGSWRSNDSDEKYAEFAVCLKEQNANFASSNAIGNNLVRRILAERQTFEALRNWLSGNVDMANRIRELLAAAGSELSLKKLYFYTSVYTHCAEGKEFVNGYLRNTVDFAEVFSCPSGSPLRPVKVCSVL